MPPAAAGDDEVSFKSTEEGLSRTFISSSERDLHVLREWISSHRSASCGFVCDERFERVSLKGLCLFIKQRRKK